MAAPVRGARIVLMPAVLTGPHSAGLGIKFYTGDMFPKQYKNVAFIARHGSWNREQKYGYDVVMAKVAGGKATIAPPGPDAAALEEAARALGERARQRRQEPQHGREDHGQEGNLRADRVGSLSGRAARGARAALARRDAHAWNHDDRSQVRLRTQHSFRNQIACSHPRRRRAMAWTDCAHLVGRTCSS